MTQSPNPFLPFVPSGISPQPTLGALAALFPPSLLYQKTSQYFRNQRLYIDGYTFKNCRFDACELITYKGTFTFDHCVIGDDTVIIYGGEALKVVKLFNSKSPYWSLFPNIVAQINPDGTFTIT